MKVPIIINGTQVTESQFNKIIIDICNDCDLEIDKFDLEILTEKLFETLNSSIDLIWELKKQQIQETDKQ